MKIRRRGAWVLMNHGQKSKSTKGLSKTRHRWSGNCEPESENIEELKLTAENYNKVNSFDTWSRVAILNTSHTGQGNVVTRSLIRLWQDYDGNTIGNKRLCLQICNPFGSSIVSILARTTKSVLSGTCAPSTPHLNEPTEFPCGKRAGRLRFLHLKQQGSPAHPHCPTHVSFGGKPHLTTNQLVKSTSVNEPQAQ